MDEDAYMEIAGRIMTDFNPLVVKINVKKAWMLIAALQLVTRHPDISQPFKMEIELIAREFQRALTHVHPEAQTLLEMGWDSTYDKEK